jgi:hypothetical protein
MQKKEFAILSAVVALFAIILAISVVAATQPNVCSRCWRPMKVEFEETRGREDGSKVTYSRWRCTQCNRTRELTRDVLW